MTEVVEIGAGCGLLSVSLQLNQQTQSAWCQVLAAAVSSTLKLSFLISA